MGHLAAGMHSGVGATGDGERRTPRPQHGVQRLLELSLHGAQGLLTGPAVEAGPVVREVDAQPHRRQPIARTALATRLGCCAGAASPPPAAGCSCRRAASSSASGVAMLLTADLGSDGYSTLVNGVVDRRRDAVLRRQPRGQRRLPRRWRRPGGCSARRRHRGADRLVGSRGRPAAAVLDTPGSVTGQACCWSAALPVLALGIAAYLGAQLGAGPHRGRRVWPGTHRCRSGGATALCQLGGALVGWLLGATIGPGTVAVILLLGPAVDLTSRMLRLDVHQKMDP